MYHILCQIDLSALIGTSTTTVTVNTDSLTLLLWITEPSDKYTPDYLIFTFSIHLSVLTEGLSYSAFVHFLWAGGDLTWRSSFRTFQWWKIPSVSIIFFKPDKMTFLLSFQKHCHLFFFFFWFSGIVFISQVSHFSNSGLLLSNFFTRSESEVEKHTCTHLFFFFNWTYIRKLDMHHVLWVDVRNVFTILHGTLVDHEDDISYSSFVSEWVTETCPWLLDEEIMRAHAVTPHHKATLNRD